MSHALLEAALSQSLGVVGSANGDVDGASTGAGAATSGASLRDGGAGGDASAIGRVETHVATAAARPPNPSQRKSVERRERRAT